MSQAGTVGGGSSGKGSFPITPYVVGPIGQAGYQTIQSALNAANAAGGGMVWVQPGIYNENLTLYDKTQVIAAVGFSDYGNTVEINGEHTPPTSGSFTFRNTYLTSATNIFNSSAAGTATLIVGDAAIGVIDGYLFNLPNWTGNLLLWDINSSFGTNDGCVNNSGGASILVFEAGMGAGNTNAMTVSGLVVIGSSEIDCPLNAVTGTTLSFDYVTFTKSPTYSDNSTGSFNFCSFVTATASAMTMNSSADIDLNTCYIDSSNDLTIAGDGAGTLTLTTVAFESAPVFSGLLTLAWSPTLTGPLTAQGNSVIGGGLSANTFYATEDNGGINATVGFTFTNDTTVSTGTGTVKMSSTNNANSSAWIKIYIGTTAYWIPAWTTNAP